MQAEEGIFQIALEQFRPIIRISDSKNSIWDDYFLIKNFGEFDAYKIRIFYKTIEDTVFQEYKDFPEKILWWGQQSGKIKIANSSTPVSCIVVYRNASTERVYLYGTNLYSQTLYTLWWEHNERGTTFPSPLKLKEYEKLIQVSSIKTQIEKRISPDETIELIENILGI